MCNIKDPSVVRPWMRSKHGHYGLDESRQNTNQPKNWVRVQANCLPRSDSSIYNNDDHGNEGEGDSTTHEHLVATEPKIFIKRPKE